jgi:small subunit ribosomal protein S20
MANETQEKETKKAKRPTSQKRQLQNERCRLQNRAVRSRLKTSLKSFLDSVKQGDKQKQMASFSEISSLVDKGVNKGVFTKNKASRVKARLSLRIKA